MRPEQLLQTTPAGIYCPPGDFFIDPSRKVDRAVITHGHADHARRGHARVMATAATCDMMRLRYGARAAGRFQETAYGEPVDIGGVGVRLVPAGHVLGSAQIVVEHRGCRVVVSGDYKRRDDPTCEAFEPVDCEAFVTEATFGLPVFRHPPAGQEIARLLHSLRLFPERCHLVGVYSLGKAQRVLRLLREAGYGEPIYLHGALWAMCALYQRHGVEFDELRQLADGDELERAGALVLAPPGTAREHWFRRHPDPVSVLASGWMRVRARQRGADLPLIISDHADWDELLTTIDDVPSAEIWVTHGSEAALLHAAALRGRAARALALVGCGDETA